MTFRESAIMDRAFGLDAIDAHDFLHGTAPCSTY
jgi:hypothetical protein